MLYEDEVQPIIVKIASPVRFETSNVVDAKFWPFHDFRAFVIDPALYPGVVPDLIRAIARRVSVLLLDALVPEPSILIDAILSSGIGVSSLVAQYWPYCVNAILRPLAVTVVDPLRGLFPSQPPVTTFQFWFE